MPRYNKTMGRITPKQELFCKEYLEDLNATRAAVRAGYSEKTATKYGPALYSTPHVQERIQELMNERSKRTEISVDMVLKELAKIAFSNIDAIARWDGDSITFFPSDTIDESVKAGVSEITSTRTELGANLKVKMHDKIAALAHIGRHLKMFTDKIEHGVEATLEELILGSMKPKDK